MSDLLDTIDVSYEKTPDGEVRVARIRFGPQYLVEVEKDAAKTSFTLVSTHHGVRVDASEQDGELYHLIEGLRQAHPGARVD